MDPHFDGMIFSTHAEELARRIGPSHPPLLLLDLRSTKEHAAGHVPGALRVTADQAAAAVPAGVAEVVVIGRERNDPEVGRALQILKGAGVRRRVELAGGMAEWLRLGLPLERRGAGAA